MITLRNPFKETTVAGELTSLMDVIFLLLIFFMLTATFKKEIQHIPLEIPLSTSPNTIKTEYLVNVDIDMVGRYFVDGKGLNRQELYSYLKNRNPGQHVVLMIHGDKKTPMQDLVYLYDMAQELGITHLGHEVRKD